VRYLVDASLSDVWYCHCEHCRRTSGHHLAATGADSESVSFVADLTLSWYSHQPDVEYGFCNQCGSSLFWRTHTRPGQTSICVGSLDDTGDLSVAGVLYRAEAGAYIAAHPDVPTEDYDRSE